MTTATARNNERAQLHKNKIGLRLRIEKYEEHFPNRIAPREFREFRGRPIGEKTRLKGRVKSQPKHKIPLSKTGPSAGSNVVLESRREFRWIMRAGRIPRESFKKNSARHGGTRTNWKSKTNNQFLSETPNSRSMEICSSSRGSTPFAHYLHLQFSSLSVFRIQHFHHLLEHLRYLEYRSGSNHRRIM